jgi:hypothetical protein
MGIRNATVPEEGTKLDGDLVRGIAKPFLEKQVKDEANARLIRDWCIHWDETWVALQADARWIECMIREGKPHRPLEETRVVLRMLTAVSNFLSEECENANLERNT